MGPALFRFRRLPSAVIGHQADGAPYMHEYVIKRTFLLAVAALCASACLLPTGAAAESVAMSATRPDEWQFAAMVYAWYPDLGGKVTFPNGGSSDISVDASDLYSNLKFAVIGAFEARKGEWGMFTDLMYMDVGQFNSRFHNMTIGNVGLPARRLGQHESDLKSDDLDAGRHLSAGHGPGRGAGRDSRARACWI